MKWAAIIQDGSGASLQDKASAYQHIHQTITQFGPGGDRSRNDWFQQSTDDQRKTVQDALFSSSFAKTVTAVGDQFHSQSLQISAQYAGKDRPTSSSVLSQLNGLSADQQQLIFAYYSPDVSSFDSWKVSLQDQDPIAGSAGGQASSAVTVKLSNSAKAVLSGAPGKTADPTASDPPDSNSTAQRALATLTTTSPAVLKNAGALQVLQQAAEARAKALDQVSTEASVPLQSAAKQQKPYTPGTRIETAV